MDRLPEKKRFLLIQRHLDVEVGMLHVISVLDEGGRSGENETEVKIANFKKERK
jgi:hypothetical protein